GHRHRQETSAVTPFAGEADCECGRYPLPMAFGGDRRLPGAHDPREIQRPMPMPEIPKVVAVRPGGGLRLFVRSDPILPNFLGNVKRISTLGRGLGEVSVHRLVLLALDLETPLLQDVARIPGMTLGQRLRPLLQLLLDVLVQVPTAEWRGVVLAPDLGVQELLEDIRQVNVIRAVEPLIRSFELLSSGLMADPQLVVLAVDVPDLRRPGLQGQGGGARQ